MARRSFIYSIQARLLLAVVFGLVLMLGGLGTISALAIRESTNRSLQERLALAHANADLLGYVLDQNLAMLSSVAFAPGVDISDGNPQPEKNALHEVFVTSMFNDGVYIIDATGRVLVSDPDRSASLPPSVVLAYPPVQEALTTAKPVVSNVYTEPPGQKVISAVVPVLKAGFVVGAVVGDIDPTSLVLSRALQTVRLGETGYIEVVDRNGVVVASSLPSRLLENSDHGNILGGLIERKETTSGTCHSGCHQGDQVPARQTEVMAFVPLTGESVKWGVTIRQSEAEALAPSRSLLRGILLVGVPSFLLSVILAWGMARSISKPIVSLTRSARRLSEGDMSQPISSSGGDEVSTLGRSLETMRSKLNSSLEVIKQWNLTLERKVEERTKQLEKLYQELQAKEATREQLLHKVITVQEEERKRLARDLHDDTSQTMAALVMALDTYVASLPTETADAERAKLADISQAARRSLDSIRRVILDLRPSILDDLGLVPALRWYAETRLEQNGVKVRLETNDCDKRLPGEVETALFRIVQEAVTNIVRHAEAENAVIAVDFQEAGVAIEVEDDGKGFDVARPRANGARTFGLEGMQERVSLLGGKMEVDSRPGSGTRITVTIPLSPQEARRA